MTALPTDLRGVVDRWVAAEGAGDAAALNAVLHDRFLFAGPYGYLLDRAAWLGRFTEGSRYVARYTSFSFVADRPARVVRDTALVVGTQRQTGTAQGEVIDGEFRGTLVLVRDPDWQIVGVHLSLPRPPSP